MRRGTHLSFKPKAFSSCHTLRHKHLQRTMHALHKQTRTHTQTVGCHHPSSDSETTTEKQTLPIFCHTRLRSPLGAHPQMVGFRISASDTFLRVDDHTISLWHVRSGNKWPVLFFQQCSWDGNDTDTGKLYRHNQNFTDLL